MLDDVAVLVSGGVDSAVLCIDLLERFHRVHPIYVRFGLRWEPEEITGLRAFLDKVARPGLEPLVTLDEPVADVYGEHWSLSGRSVPGRDSADGAVYLAGRNLLLITKAAVWCGIRGVETLAIGTLAGNPFSDGSTEFFESMEASIKIGLGVGVRLIRPFDRWNKGEVIRRGATLPLGLTFSCLDPVAGQPCGACNKCEERRRGFHSAGLADTSSPSSVAS